MLLRSCPRLLSFPRRVRGKLTQFQGISPRGRSLRGIYVIARAEPIIGQHVSGEAGFDVDEGRLLRLLFTPIVERAREDKLQSSDEDPSVVHVSKLSRGCANFVEQDSYEENPELLISSLLRGSNNSISWLLGQLVHTSIELSVDKKVIDGCEVVSEKEVKKEVEVDCEPGKVVVKGHVDLYVKCPQEEFAVELKYRSTGELGLRSYYQTMTYSAALGVPVYVVIITPNKVTVEKVEADEGFLRRVVNDFKCKGYLEEIVFNPDARPCNNCANKANCELWKRAVGVLVSKVKR
ncbi:hypothetical protein Igni_1096 [Ignicoccus hospitalis KIN4/I]|uniref:PD-(D/E)XK endonuclease-like domain-containing protein n=1 Tax=Ignicoccus hospitalis (strain KIN4/I / DSM 18386 / JCM 14125) TaxID=453591 RepID=A8ABH1_IGNH4|nr:hypothetical protein Igni_1096 [Ignicoccus hospitalis KIN4/I]